MAVQIFTMKLNFGSLLFFPDNESTKKFIHWDYKGGNMCKKEPVLYLQEVERHFLFVFFTWCNSRWIKNNE